MQGPLSGIRIIDMSRVLAGPYCTMLLGDMGADVIKIEPPKGDDTRHWGPPYMKGESAYYLSCNRNKRSIVLDLKTQAGRFVLARLLRTADVAVENFRLGTMEAWGLGYDERLALENPRLIYCNISGFGRTGPSAGLPGYDFLIQAMGGLMSITGEPDGEPMKVGVPVTDLTTGMMAAFGIVSALMHRERHGTGQRVDLSLLETQVSWLANVASNFLVSGELPKRYGNAHPNVVPYQTFPANDGQVVVAVGNDAQFQRLCALLGVPALATDPRFTTNSLRVEHREALINLLKPAFGARSVSEWVSLFREADIPGGPVNRVDQVFADPQVQHRGMVTSVSHPRLGAVPQVGIPIELSRSPGTIRHHPPLKGEHSTEVLHEAGFSDEEIAALLESGAVMAHP